MNKKINSTSFRQIFLYGRDYSQANVLEDDSVKKEKEKKKKGGAIDSVQEGNFPYLLVIEDTKEQDTFRTINKHDSSVNILQKFKDSMVAKFPILNS